MKPSPSIEETKEFLKKSYILDSQFDEIMEFVRSNGYHPNEKELFQILSELQKETV